MLFPTEAEALALEPLGFALRLGVQYQWLNEGYRTLEDFLERFPSKRRNQLRRERRAPAEQGLEIRVLRGEALAEVDPKEPFRLYACTVDKFAWGRRFLTPDFFARMLDQLPAPGGARRGRAGDRVVAGAFNLAGDRRALRPLLGVLRGAPLPALQRLPLPPDGRGASGGGWPASSPGAGGEHKLIRGFTPSLTYSAHCPLPPGAWTGRCATSWPTSGRPSRPACPAWRAETGFKD